MPFGFNGKILRVNLSQARVTIEKKDKMFYRRYVGGRGFSLYFLLKELRPGIDPLGPDNKLIFTTSIITGMPFSGASRFTVAAKSPLTGGYGDANAGGFWGPELKFAGYDGIILEGKADRPVYLWIHDGGVEIKDAGHIWGKVTGEAQAIIRKELKDNLVRVAQIGPAGEKLVRFAGIINELRSVNGRTGVGAVMGSKNLKAIAVRGTKKVEMKDPDLVKAQVKWFNENFKYNPVDSGLLDLGSSGDVLPLNEMGILPTRNFREGAIEGAEQISGEQLKKELVINKRGCYACPIGCWQVVKVDEPYSVDPIYGGPQYETIAALGSLCGVTDLKAIAKGNEICNAYGMDTISAGNAVAFAMECYENNIITRDDTNGIDLTFGNTEAMVNLVKAIAERQGIGDTLAEGVLRAATKFGKGAEKFAMHVKGQEVPMHEPRGKTGVGIGYAVSPIGASHLQAEHDTNFAVEGTFLKQIAPLGILNPVGSTDLGPKKVRLFVYLQFLWSLYDMLDLCIYSAAPGGTWTISKIVELVRAGTGWETSMWELMKAGERGINLARCFNAREGFTSEDDCLPQRFFRPFEVGPLKGEGISKEKFKKALISYYQMMGWNPDTGVPTKSKIEELDIEWVAEIIKLS